MSQQALIKRSAAAAAANTDTVLFTPAAGTRYRLLAFHVVNETAAQVAGMSFELRIGANIVTIVGFDVAAAPIGQTSKQAIIAEEFVGNGSDAINGRNLTALNTASIAAYCLVYETVE
ncbi:MAG: hypothetical protein H0V07_06235 [Propionibacteriales bacterium]|nr:hypothetical protein [Propionibacteriales bacterium]